MIYFTAPTGGVDTREAGAITGDLQAAIRADRTVAITYLGAANWYTVTGGPLPQPWLNDTDVELWLSRDPGTDEWGNPAATTLTDIPHRPDPATQTAAEYAAWRATLPPPPHA